MFSRGYKQTVRATTLSLALAVSLCSTATAAVHPGTVALDYRNAPVWSNYLDFERVGLSPRAGAAGDSLRSHGIKVYYWMQPFLQTYLGKPIRDIPYDAARWAVSEQYGAVMDCSDVGYVEAKTCDFRVPGYPDALANSVLLKLHPCDGLLYDYGCESIGWIPSCAALGAGSAEWGEGYRLYRAAMKVGTLGIPALAQCNAWTGWLPSVSDGLFLEQVGSLTGYQRAWDLLQAKPTSIVYCPQSTPQYRRCLATMALVAGCGFNYMGLPAMTNSLRDYEHFEMSLGTPGTSIIVLAPGVYYRPFSRGWALLNLAPQVYSYQNFKLAPNDGLVVQTRDERGRYITKKTNVGR
jgi:hypothetical protein